MPKAPPRRAALLLIAGALVAGPVRAHDTWLRPTTAQPDPALLLLELAGGARYPRVDDSVPTARIARSGCVDAAGNRHALVARGNRDMALELRSRAGSAAATACWVALQPARISLEPRLVQTYLDDVRASPAVRVAWARQLQAGGTWNEVYRKLARTEREPSASPSGLERLRMPLGAPLELLPVGGQAVQARQPAEFQALADGRPVTGLAVEFVSARSPLGVWQQTDARGRVSLALPFAGEWLLRATVLELPDADGVWHSRFATLTVQVR